MSDKRIVVLDTRHQVIEIHRYLNHVIQQQPLAGLVAPTRTSAMNFIQAIVAEIMESKNQAIYGASTTDWEVVYASMLFNIDVAQVLHRQVKLSNRIFNHDVIHTIYDDIRTQINAHERYTSYVKWEVINTGSVILLSEVGDQRILAWEYLQNAQEEHYVTLDLNRVYEELQKEFTKNFGPYPESQIDAMLLKTVMDTFPQLNRIDRYQEEINYDMAAAYGIVNLHEWIGTYINRVLNSFNVGMFAQHIPAGTKYDFNYCSHKLTIKAQQDPITETDDDAELAKQLLRGDYLPIKERERAEQYILNNQ